MDKKRQVAGALSAILLVTSLPGPILAKEGQDLPGIRAEAEDSFHSRVIDTQVKAKKLETQNQTLLQARATQEDPEPEESEEGQTVTQDNFVFDVGTRSIVGYTGEGGEDVELTLPDSFEVNGESIPVENLGKEDDNLAIFEEKIFKKITLPDNLKTIRNSALARVTIQSELIIPKTVTSIEWGAFSGGTFEKVTFTATEASITLGPNIFQYATLKDIDLTGLEEISENMFEGCKGLQKLTLPTSLKSIKEQAFTESEIEEIEFNSVVKLEGGGIFSACPKLKKVKLPKGLKKIPKNTFYNCPSLLTIEIPSTVETIGRDAFGSFDGYDPAHTIIINGPKREGFPPENSYAEGSEIVYETEEKEENVIKDNLLKALINRQFNQDIQKENDNIKDESQKKPLRNESDPVTETDLKRLIELYFIEEEEAVEDLQGIEKATNLTRLFINFKGTNLEPLRELTSLRGLGLCPAQESYMDSSMPGRPRKCYKAKEKSPLADLAPIQDLTNLTTLIVEDAEVENLQPIKNLTNLSYLNLNGNKIENDQLQYLKWSNPNKESTSRLEIYRNRITDDRLLGGERENFPFNIVLGEDQKPVLKLTEMTFTNPLLNSKGEHVQLVSSNLREVDGVENEKYQIINLEKGKKTIEIPYKNGTGGVLTLDVSQIKEEKDPNPESQTYPATFFVTGWEDGAYVGNLYQAKIELSTQAGEKVDPQEGSSVKWNLLPGTYKYKVSSPGYSEGKGTITIDQKGVMEQVELQKITSDKDYKQPKIETISLVQVGNSNRELAKGNINGNIISFIVEDPEARELIYNGQATIKATTRNGYSFLATKFTSPFSGTVEGPAQGDIQWLNGDGGSIPFGKNAITTFSLEGKGNKSSYYVMYIKESKNQCGVIFSTISDGDDYLGRLHIPDGTGQAGYEVSQWVQLVEKGKPIIEPIKWIKEKTGKNAYLILTPNSGGFSGWYHANFESQEYNFDKQAPIERDMSLNARFENSSSFYDFPKPFTVHVPTWTIHGEGDDIDDMLDEMKLEWSVNDDKEYKELKNPRDIKVMAGDTLNFKLTEVGKKWKIASVVACYGNLQPSITKDKNGIYHFKPVPAQDSNRFLKNQINIGFIKAEDDHSGPYDHGQQYYINQLKDGAELMFENIEMASPENENPMTPLAQAGDTIRFKVSGANIDEVKVTGRNQKEDIKLTLENVEENEEIQLTTRHYSFTMPNEDVDLHVKGKYRPANDKKAINFKVLDSQDKEITKDQIQSFNITVEGKTYPVTLGKETYLPVNARSLNYSYEIVLKDNTRDYGFFVLNPKDIPNPQIIKLKGKDKTKEEFDKLVKRVNRFIEDTEYTEESRKELKDARDKIVSMVNQGKMTTDKAYTELAKAMQKFIQDNNKENPTTDKEKAKESLKDLINRLSNLKKADYESKAWDAFDKKMDKAKSVLRDTNSSVDDLNAARTGLAQAKDELDRHKIVPEDMTKEEKNLRDLIKTIEKLEEKNYSKETWKDLKYALDDAKNELNYSKRTERSLERAYDKLNKAYKDLKLADKLAEEAEKINQDHKVLVRNSSYQNMTDIKSHWARDFIKYCMDRGYLVGTSITNFSPDRPTTRAEFVTVLSRLAGIKEENYKKNKFTDVPKGVYYEAAVNWAQDKKIVEGIGNNKFAPDQTMTREEMATILDRYFQAIKKDYGARGALYFQDQGDISLWAADSVKRMTQAGILHGTDRNTFEPKSSFTRAELATVIYQLNK